MFREGYGHCRVSTCIVVGLLYMVVYLGIIADLRIRVFPLPGNSVDIHVRIIRRITILNYSSKKYPRVFKYAVIKGVFRVKKTSILDS